MGTRRASVWTYHPTDKRIDRTAPDVCSALLHCLPTRGAEPARLARTDPGRRMVRELLEIQNVLANRDDASPFGFGVLDGRPLPRRYVEVVGLDNTVGEVVVASDGYLGPVPILRATGREPGLDG
ncbi:hypothetical protein AB0B52_37600 [Streptomyces griseofuscus]|uniref:hypothetical protein n=1 Tax=Streptomyces griseofuscus TaxID=146922 RepID=UPI00340B77B3